jgi:hypothetical protein
MWAKPTQRRKATKISLPSQAHKPPSVRSARRKVLPSTSDKAQPPRVGGAINPLHSTPPPARHHELAPFYVARLLPPLPARPPANPPAPPPPPLLLLYRRRGRRFRANASPTRRRTFSCPPSADKPSINPNPTSHTHSLFLSLARRPGRHRANGSRRPPTPPSRPPRPPRPGLPTPSGG